MIAADIVDSQLGIPNGVSVRSNNPTWLPGKNRIPLGRGICSLTGERVDIIRIERRYEFPLDMDERLVSLLHPSLNDSTIVVLSAPSIKYGPDITVLTTKESLIQDKGLASNAKKVDLKNLHRDIIESELPTPFVYLSVGRNRKMIESLRMTTDDRFLSVAGDITFGKKMKSENPIVRIDLIRDRINAIWDGTYKTYKELSQLGLDRASAEDIFLRRAL